MTHVQNTNGLYHNVGQVAHFVQGLAKTGFTLIYSLSTLRPSPAALKGQRAKGYEAGSAHNFSVCVTFCVCRAPVCLNGGSVTLKETPDAEEFVFN